MELIDACRLGDLETAVSLLNNGVDVNTRDNTGWTGLLYACSRNYLELVRLLLQYGCDVKFKDRSGWTGLMYASSRGHFEIVKILIEKDSSIVNDKNNCGWTSLMLTSSETIARVLIKKGADVNSLSTTLSSALICNSIKGNTEIVSLLLQHKADVNRIDEYKKTSLMYASGKGHLEVVRLLIEHGADVNIKSFNGVTSIMYASCEGHLDIIRSHIEHGAYTDRCDVMAYNLGHFHVVYYLMGIDDTILKRLPKDEKLTKYIQSMDALKRFRTRVKRYSGLCGLTPKRLSSFLSLIKKREFGEWWYSPEAPGGKRHLENMRQWFSTTHGL